MGVGPDWNSRVDLQQAFDWTTSKLGSMWEWVQAFADTHVTYAPLMTPVVAVGAGCIALYAVHVQRTIAFRVTCSLLRYLHRPTIARCFFPIGTGATPAASRWQ